MAGRPTADKDFALKLGPMVSDIFPIAFRALSAGTFFVVLSCTLAWSKFTPFSAYLLALLLAATFIAWRRDPNSPRVFSFSLSQWPTYALYTGLLLAAAYLRFAGIEAIPLWADEDDHNARLLRNADTFWLAASWAQSPPLYYYFTVFSALIFGENAFGFRFFSALLGTFSVPLFFSLALKIFRQKFMAFAAALVFLFQPYLIAYSQEAKPYSTGLFFSLIFFHALFDFAKGTGNRGQILKLGAATLLLLLTMGLQPPLLIFSAAVPLFVLLLLARDRRKQAFALLTCMAAVAAAYLPIQLYIISLNKFFFRATNEIRLPAEWFDLFITHWKLTEELELFWWLLPLALAISLYKFTRSTLFQFRAVLILASLIFPLLIFFSFRYLIDWDLSTRYIFLYLPLYILALFSSVEALAETLPKEKVRIAATALFLGCLLALTLILNPFKYPKKTNEKKWQDLYAFLESSDASNAVGFIFTLTQLNEFNRGGFFLLDHYYSDRLKEKIELDSAWDVMENGGNQTRNILLALEKKRNYSRTYLFSPHADSQARPEHYEYSSSLGPQFHFFQEEGGDWGATLTILENREGFASTLERFLLELDREEKREEVKAGVYEILSAINLAKDNCPEARLWFLKSLPNCQNYGQCENKAFLEERLDQKCPGAPKGP